jgi:thiosulfate/3-mercaptopyruvate sulfurtransferase
MSAMHPLIDPAALQAAASRVRIVDCSHDLVQPTLGQQQFEQGHIPGAVHAHLDRDLSGPTHGSNGRHPLPTAEAFCAWLGRQGITPGMTVVAYDRSGGMYAARLWWMLRWVGHAQVRVLDGGWKAWTGAGLPVEIGVPAAAATDATAYPAVLPQGAQAVDAAFVLGNLQDKAAVLVDARAAGRYAGEGETIDPIGGHIPGALNRPFMDNLGADGCFKSATTLRAEWQAVAGAHLQGPAAPGGPAAALVMQCGSGVTACHNLLALELAGLGGARLYPGSWSEWCSDRSRPMATGPQP